MTDKPNTPARSLNKSERPPPLDLISFDQAYEILYRRFGATNVELAMWIQNDLQAWRFNRSENCFLPFSYPVDGTHPTTPESAVTLLHEKNVKFSQSEIDSFDPEEIVTSIYKNYADYLPSRWISYLEVKARIDSAAKAKPTLNLNGVYEEWRRLHKAISCGENDVEFKVVGKTPGSYTLDFEKLEKLKNEHKETEIEAEIQKSLERGLFRASEIEKFIKRHIEQASPAPEQSPATPAPVVPASDGPAQKPRRTKRLTWKDVAFTYVVGIYKAGQYANAKDFYQALKNKAGPDSPFDVGTGDNRGSLFVREINKVLILKTLENAMPRIRPLAK